MELRREVEITGVLASTRQTLTITSSIQWNLPDKVRLTVGPETTVTDGLHLSVYDQRTREYSVREGTLPVAAAQKRVFGGLLPFVSSETITSARIVRGEVLSLAGAKFRLHSPPGGGPPSRA